MFTVELYARIRRAVMVDGLSRREAATRFGVHRNTITKMLQFSVPPGYRRRERPASKKLGPQMAWIDALLEADRGVHKKQRHTAHRIWMRLRDEKPDHPIGEPTVRQYVRERKRQLGITGREIFVPQSYELGQEAQVDWFEAVARLDGQPRTLQFFAMRSMASGGAFHRAYTNATQQAFLEAHELGFAYFGGAFHTLRYDFVPSNKIVILWRTALCGRGVQVP